MNRTLKRGVTACQRGVTLVELVVAIVVIALAGAALLGTLSYLAGTGTTPLLQAQAQSIANAYLAEITGRSFTDPNGVDGEGNRAQFDDVDDYNGLSDAAAQDAFGNVVGNFPVRVRLTAGGLGALPANDVWRIDVSVDYADSTLVATGYKTRHP